MHPHTWRLLFLAKNNMISTDHPSYSPDLAPATFFLFPKVKMIMWGEHFGDVENIKYEATRLLKKLALQDMQHLFSTLEKALRQVHSPWGRVLWG
jgi:hypothetical protein